jgi:hypothetical protein
MQGRNELVDKVYLALELTKISCGSGKETKEYTAKSFKYYLYELTGIEDFGNIPELRQELETVKNDYATLKKDFDINIENYYNRKHGKALTYLEEVKGDMEPYVYEQLKNLLRS